MRLENYLNQLIYGINFLAVMGLLFSFVSCYVSPETTTIFAFFGLAYPIFLVLNCFFVAYWGVKRKKKVFLSISILLIGWSHFFNFFQFPFHSPSSESNTVTVMSYNVRLFDLYDWTKMDSVKQKIINLVNINNPDVICFQEYYIKGANDALKNSLKMNYSFEHFTQSTIREGKKAGVGTAIYSKYQIINSGKILFEDEKSNHCTFVDIIKEKDTIRIYNAHLGSIRFDYDDYTFLSGEESKTLEEDIIPFKKVIKRLRGGFQKRVGQVNKIVEEINSSPYPTLLAVDMNDTPVSYSYNQLAAVLEDSFTVKGNWVGSTYIGLIPWLRIDYLWHNEKFTTASFSTIREKFSDHRPIIGTYSLVKH